MAIAARIAVVAALCAGATASAAPLRVGVALDGRSAPLMHGLAFWSVATCAVAWGLVGRLPR